MTRHGWPIGQAFGECCIFNPVYIGFAETSSYRSFQFSFFPAFHWASIGKPLMTLVSFFKTMTSYQVHWSPSVGKPRMTLVSFVNGMIQGLLMNHMRFPDLVIIWVVHLLDRLKQVGITTVSDQTACLL